MLLFIVGTGRSGTSLMQSMLASHSEIAYLPETIFFRRFVVNRGKGTNLNAWISEQNKSEIVAYLNGDRYFQRTRMDASDLFGHDEAVFPDSPIALYSALLQEKKQLDRCGIVGDKDPKSIEHLRVLYAFDPAAFVIQMVRDPRDVLVSRKKAEWSKGHSLIKHLFAIRIQSRLANRYFASAINQKYIRIKYEMLIRNPELELKNICERLNIDFESRMLDFGRVAKSLVSKEEYSWKKETTGDLIRDNFDNWPRELSKYEIAMTETICENVFLNEGYELSKAISEITVGEKFQVRFYQLLVPAADLIYQIFNWIKNKASVDAINKRSSV